MILVECWQSIGTVSKGSVSKINRLHQNSKLFLEGRLIKNSSGDSQRKIIECHKLVCALEINSPKNHLTRNLYFTPGRYQQDEVAMYIVLQYCQ